MDAKRIIAHMAKINWSAVGAILAVVSLIFAAYISFYYVHPNVTFDIVNDVNVLDVHKPLNELNIYFQGEDIQQRNLNLRVISIKIENTGTEHILQNYYDDNVIFGLQIDNGHVIEARLIDSNSKYLMSNLNIKTINNTIEFSKPIFERNNYFIAEILVLHDKNKMPTLVPLGKIAGIDKLEIKHSYTEDQLFFDDLFSGSLIVHFMRFGIYTGIFLTGLLAAVLISDQIDKRKIGRINHNRSLLVRKLEVFDELSLNNKK